METLNFETNNTINNPSNDIMSLFLEIWNKLNLFETTEIVNQKWEKEQWYKNINAISTLSIVVDYLCQSWKDDEKQFFLDTIKSDWDEAYKKLWLLALKIRKEKDSTSFWQSLIKSNEEKLTNTNSVWYPVIPSIVLPIWYSNNVPTNLIHKYFESQLVKS